MTSDFISFIRRDEITCVWGLFVFNELAKAKAKASLNLSKEDVSEKKNKNQDKAMETRCMNIGKRRSSKIAKLQHGTTPPKDIIFLTCVL